MVEIFTIVGFALACYSIVANDAIQTLGTFLASNGHRRWWVLWIYACSILVVVLVYSWIVYDGDVSYQRLSKFPPPEGGIRWIHAIPPLILMILTRYGIPVSTTFLILTVFKPGNLQSMLTKSMLGYAVAFVVGFAVYQMIAKLLRPWFESECPRKAMPMWIFLQWSATAFLWSNWLIQDLANIFVYLPRSLALWQLIGSIIFMLLLHAFIFYFRGGAIQKIVTGKTHTTDIRSATVIDFLYGTILFIFKEVSKIPMSTTWVFLGLLAGREIALALRFRRRTPGEATRAVSLDAAKALCGLGVSIALALGLPVLEEQLNRIGGNAPEAVETVEPAEEIDSAPPLNGGGGS